MEKALKPYQDYKTNTPDWLGPIPGHWRLEPAWAVLEERKVKNDGLKERTVLSLSYGRIIRRDMEGFKGLSPASFDDYQILEPGNVVMRSTDLQNDQTSLRFGYVQEHGIITSAYMALAAKEPLDSQFMYRYLHALDTKKVFYGMGSGLRQSIGFADLKRLPIPVPPDEEQRVITSHLAWFDKKVDRLIRTKQRLIELLNEQKRAIIQRAITRGVNPDARFGSSELDWVEEIPAHWAELPLKRVAETDNSGSYGEDPEAGEVVYPVATTAQIDSDGRFAVGDMSRRGFSKSEAQRYLCRPGQILVVKSSGSIFNVVSGKAGLVSDDSPPFVFSNFLLRVRPDEGMVDSEFLYLVLTSALTRHRVYRMVSGTTYPNLRVEEYRSAPLPVPPLSEQKRIVEIVRSETSDLDGAIAYAKHEVDLIREYRTRLIADVVTGKLDVRNIEVSALKDAGVKADEKDTIDSYNRQEAVQ